MNMLEAMRDTVAKMEEELLSKGTERANAAVSGDMRPPHIRGMLRVMESGDNPQHPGQGFGEGKMGRWLGWAQAAVVAMGLATLEDMKNINRRHADPPTAPANDNKPSAAAINDLVTYFHGKSKAAGWWVDLATGEDLTKNPFVIGTKLMLCVSELSEAMEGLRKDLMDDKLPHRKMAEVELGDTLIRVFDLAGALGYDLGGATVEKDAFNSVRSDHKPGARMLAGGKAY